MQKPNYFRKFAHLLWAIPLTVGGMYVASNYDQVPTQQALNIVTEKEEHGPQYDRPDLAMLQEIEMTKDPLTGKVPYEKRRLAIAEAKRRLQGKNKGTRTEAAIANVSWTQRGPSNVGGRTRTLLWDPNDINKKKVWAGAAGGGLWYTNDITVASPVWNSVSEIWSNVAVVALAFDPTNTQILYAGTGEGWSNADAIRGDGLWKSVDGGATWSQLASTDNNSTFFYIQKLAVTSTGRLLAGTSTGLQVSNDKGLTWSTAFTGFISDIEIASNGTIYASTGKYGTAGKIYRSTDGGSVFTDITPAGTQERIELAVAPSSASTIYAVASLTTNVSWIKKSIDGGTTWTSMTIPKYLEQNCVASTSNDFTRGQAWYDLALAVKPDNANVLFAGGIDINRYNGTSWSTITYWTGGCSKPFVHADQHTIAFRPGFPNEAVFGNDGGVYYSNTLANTAPAFSPRNSGYNVTQFYAAAIHPTSGSNFFLAGAQDNGTQKFSAAGINATTEVTGGDGAFCFINQKNPAYQVTAYTNNNYYVSSNGGSTFGTLSANSDGQFINPSDLDDNLNLLYSCAASNSIRRINVATKANSLVTVAVGSSTPSHIRVSPYATTTSTLFIGTRAGRVYKVANAQTGTSLTATDITGNIVVPTNANVSCIEVGASESELLVTYSNYGVQSVWYTANGGVSWTSLDNGHGLPDMPIRWALFNPFNRRQVLLATEAGVWSSSDILAPVSATFWGPTNGNLANVRVDMLQYRASDKLVAVATHGRGLYTGYPFGLPTVAVNNGDESTHTVTGSSTSLESRAAAGKAEVTVYPNPGNGAYKVRLTGDTAEQVSINVFDAVGKSVKTFRFAKEAGVFEQEIDLTSLDNGVYSLQIVDSTGKVVRRVVKN